MSVKCILAHHLSNTGLYIGTSRLQAMLQALRRDLSIYNMVAWKCGGQLYWTEVRRCFTTVALL